MQAPAAVNASPGNTGRSTRS